jgi:hypothetical protein
MDQVDRPDIERRLNPDAAAERHHTLDEVEADLAEIETTVDVSGLYLNEPVGADGFGKTNKQPHGKGRRLAVTSIKQCLVFRGKLNGGMHGGKLAAGATGEKIFIREKSRRLADSPIFNLKIFDAQIFAQIIGDDRQAARLCLACDQDIEGAIV